jgi:predicted membrane channel-forming protein YqfA (hemolysin III family)
MDPTQIRIFLVMGLISLLFAAQMAMQTGGLVALP